MGTMDRVIRFITRLGRLNLFFVLESNLRWLNPGGSAHRHGTDEPLSDLCAVRHQDLRHHRKIPVARHSELRLDARFAGNADQPWRIGRNGCLGLPVVKPGFHCPDRSTARVGCGRSSPSVLLLWIGSPVMFMS